jgi:hypothetical protein
MDTKKWVILVICKSVSTRKIGKICLFGHIIVWIIIKSQTYVIIKLKFIDLFHYAHRTKEKRLF